MSTKEMVHAKLWHTRKCNNKIDESTNDGIKDNHEQLFVDFTTFENISLNGKMKPP